MNIFLDGPGWVEFELSVNGAGEHMLWHRTLPNGSRDTTYYDLQHYDNCPDCLRSFRERFHGDGWGGRRSTIAILAAMGKFDPNKVVVRNGD